MTRLRKMACAGTSGAGETLFSRTLFVTAQVLISMLLLSPSVRAEVAPVVINIPEPTVWTGQRLPFFVEVRTRGSFGGATSFDLPKVPGSVILAAGRPVVESKEFEGSTWFVQRHEFAVFSQRTGPVAIPTFTVRYGTRDEYSGPVTEHTDEVPATKVEIKRPPDSEDVGFLITAEEVEITEKWDPPPGSAKVGDVFKRTISQRADQMTGMALHPAPTNAPTGVRVYLGQPEVSDNTERGAFSGERQETISYLMEASGPVTLPELRFVWWNPQKQQLQEKILPAVTLDVAPSSVMAEAGPAALPRRVWPYLLAMIFGGGAIIGFRRRLATRARLCWARLNPPDRIAARQVLRACREDHAANAEAAWRLWLNTQSTGFQPSPELYAAAQELQRQLFGLKPEGVWRGSSFARAFREELVTMKSRSSRKSASALPALNPCDGS